MVYCISDIHGNYGLYKQLMDKLCLSEKDTVFILGDICDRGKNPMSILEDIMARTNVIPLAGNHDFVAAYCLGILTMELTEENAEKLDVETLQGIMEWLADGGETTLKDFRELPQDRQELILDFIGEFDLYAEVTVNGQEYVLVHAGLDNFSMNKPLDAYSLDELLFSRPDYSKEYFDDKIVITGHTPTALIPDNPRPGYIYKAHNHIAIDCGCGFGQRLGAICLDTGEEFYVE